MKRYGGRSRRDIFEQVERAALLPLPADSFQYAKWGVAKVHHDYHVQIDEHYYSVPSELVHERVTVRKTAGTVELLHKHRIVAVHHRAWAQMDSSGVLEWGRSVGPMTEAMVMRILESRSVMQPGLRSPLGLRRVGKRYGPHRTEAACKLALSYGGCSYKSVERLRKLGREKGDDAAEERLPVEHDNVRGPDSFDRPGESRKERKT